MHSTGHLGIVSRCLYQSFQQSTYDPQEPTSSLQRYLNARSGSRADMHVYVQCIEDTSSALVYIVNNRHTHTHIQREFHPETKHVWQSCVPRQTGKTSSCIQNCEGPKIPTRRRTWTRYRCVRVINFQLINVLQSHCRGKCSSFPETVTVNTVCLFAQPTRKSSRFSATQPIIYLQSAPKFRDHCMGLRKPWIFQQFVTVFGRVAQYMLIVRFRTDRKSEFTAPYLSSGNILLLIVSPLASKLLTPIVHPPSEASQLAHV